MRTSVQKWGNSLALRIPKAMVEQMSLESGSEVDLRAEGDEIVVRRAQPKFDL